MLNWNWPAEKVRLFGVPGVVEVGKRSVQLSAERVFIVRNAELKDKLR